MCMGHLTDNNETYLSHLKFACTLGIGFLYRSVFFLTHGILPMIAIPKHLNIDATLEMIREAKNHADNRKND